MDREYSSARAVFDVLDGEDSAALLMEASSTGNDTALQAMLCQPQWVDTALEEPITISSEYCHRADETEVRQVYARPMMNLQRAIIKVAQNGHAAAMSVLLDFALRQSVKYDDLVTYRVNITAIRSKNTAVYEALATAYPQALFDRVHHGRLPLQIAAKERRWDVVAVILHLGASPQRLSTSSEDNKGSYKQSLLSLVARAEGTHMTELVLQYGAPVIRSGALHYAAELGALDTMSVLIQHGADVNEILPEDTLRLHDGALYATWTPMHFAACGGKANAIALLESHGARSDVKDRNGRTPAQLIQGVLDDSKSEGMRRGNVEEWMRQPEVEDAVK